MTPRVASNLRQGRILRLSTPDVQEILDSAGAFEIDPDHVEVGLYRCRAGGKRCENAFPWEYLMNTSGREATCGKCNRPAFLIEVVGLWGDLKNEPMRLKLEEDQRELRRVLDLLEERIQEDDEL